MLPHGGEVDKHHPDVGRAGGVKGDGKSHRGSQSPGHNKIGKHKKHGKDKSKKKHHKKAKHPGGKKHHP